MAGLQMLRVDFAGAVPSWPEVIAKAEEIGGMALMFEPGRIDAEDPEMNARLASAEAAGQPGQDSAWGNLFFTLWPDLGNVAVKRSNDARTIDVTDYSQASSTLVALLQHALVALGGTMRGGELLPLDAPLTPEKLRRERQRESRLAMGGCLMIVGLLATAVAVVGLLSWAAWTGLRALLAG